ncbi:MAG TPA: hypothetical protein VGB04_11765 [Allosphingosinicella sp.]|jgi:hypothetical protein
MRHFIYYAMPVALAACVAYSAIKLWGDVAARRYGLAVLGLLALLGSLGLAIILVLILAQPSY